VIGCLGIVGVFVLLLIVGLLAGGGRQSGGGTPQPLAAQPPTAQSAPTAAAQKPTLPPPTATVVPTIRPTVAPTTAPSPTVAHVPVIGDRVESAGVAITVNSVKRLATTGPFSKAEAGKEFAVVDVTVENPGRDNAPYNPFYFKVKDAEGFEYNTAFASLDQALKSGELAKGEKARGLIAFQVPVGDKGLVLSYQPIVLFGGYQTIRINLEAQ
jgi:hypothetical protein